MQNANFRLLDHFETCDQSLLNGLINRSSTIDNLSFMFLSNLSFSWLGSCITSFSTFPSSDQVRVEYQDLQDLQDLKVQILREVKTFVFSIGSYYSIGL